MIETVVKTDFTYIQWLFLLCVFKIVDNSTFEFWANLANFHCCFWMGGCDDNSKFRVGWVRTSDEASLRLNFVFVQSILTPHHQIANSQFFHKKWLINIYFTSRKYSWVKKYDSTMLRRLEFMLVLVKKHISRYLIF